MKFKSRIPTVIKRLRAAANEAVQETAEDCRDEAIRLAPEDTGALKQSIEAHPTGHAEAVWGTDIGYGKFVNYGTIHTAAQPFFDPAFELGADILTRKMRSKVKKI